MLECPDCRGTGQRRVFNAKAPTNLSDLATCPTCHGTGQLADAPPTPARGRSPSESAPPDGTSDPSVEQPSAQD
jgi:DnaJ-class molecular chaperone